MRSQTPLIAKHASRQTTPTKQKHPAHNIKNVATSNSWNPVKQGANHHPKERAKFYSNRLYHDGQEVSEPREVRPPPLQLGDLECVRKLGTGSYGSVLLVRVRPREEAHRLDRPGSLFALKALRKADMRTSDNKHPDDTDTEKEILCRLQWSPWVNGVIDAFHDSLNLYLLLECIPAGVLRDIIYRRGPLDANMARFYYANIVCALEFLHGKEIVHRDLKPANILLKADGYIALVDFGLAKPEADARTWALVGTPNYMAPELSMSEKGMGYGVDWWSSGVILYEMVTKQLPFYGETESEIYKRVTEGKYTWPKTLHVEELLESIVAGLLTHDPASRLGVAKKVGDDPWLSSIDWNKLDGHSYVAPWVPGDVHLSQKWQDKGLPLQESVPGLKIATPPEHLRNDGRMYRKKRPHVVELRDDARN